MATTSGRRIIALEMSALMRRRIPGRDRTTERSLSSDLDRHTGVGGVPPSIALVAGSRVSYRRIELARTGYHVARRGVAPNRFIDTLGSNRPR